MELSRATLSNPVKFGDDFELDFRTYELRRAGRPLKLERIPMDLLLLLVEQQGQLVSREQIIEKIWGKDVFLDTDNSINAAIRKIRQVLKDDPERPRFVQTITGRGYRFIAPVEEVLPPPAAEPKAPSQPAAENLIGRKVSHYRILQILGGGGMGVVYKAEDLRLGRRVALKFLPSELATDPKAFARFEREARAASALDHPNICSIYQLGEHEGQPFIVMQLLEGQTLREWIESPARQSTPEGLSQFLDIAIQIADGLEAAHQKGIIHRDIKPANIFITSRGQAKILDFGVAKFLELPEGALELSASAQETVPSANPTLTGTGVSMGTPFYLSPEQVRGEKLDARSDLFSLGLVLYEMATGHKAFPGKTVTVIRDAVLHQPAVPARQMNSQMPAELEQIISKALEKDRNRRYQSAQELRSDLERLRSGLTLVVAPRRKAWAWTSAAVAAIALVLFAMNVGGVRERVFRHSPPAPSGAEFKARPSVAVLGFKNLSGKEDEAWISTALAEMVGAELAAGQQLRIIPSEDVTRMKLDLSLPPADSYSQDTLKKIRNHLSADLVVLGSYLAVGRDSGGKVRVDLQLQDTRAGETVAVISQDGTEAELADLVSRGGARLRQNLGISGVSAADTRQVRASIPANPEAARLYAQGLLKLQSFDALAARDLLEKAIAADPNHALSHSALAESWSVLGYIPKAQEEARKALDLSADLSRADRLLVEGRYRELLPDFPAAIEIYRTLRNFFPDDLEYGLRLASAQSHGSFAKDALQTVARMRSLPEPENKDARIDLAEAKAAEHLGDFPLMQRAAAAAAEKAQAQGSRLLMAEAKEQEGWAWGHLGDFKKAMAAYSQAQELSAAGNPNTLATVFYGTATALLDKGDYDGARKFYEDSQRIYRQIGSRQNEAFATSGIGNVLFSQGKYVEAKRYYEVALQVHRELADPTAMGSDLGNIANALIYLGELAEATRMQEQSLQAYRQVGAKLGEATTLASLGSLLVDRGELVAAKQTLEQAMAVQKQSGQELIRGYVLFSVARILLAQDRLKDAQATAEQALALRKEHNEEGLVAESQSQLAEILLEQGKAAEAESLLRGAAEVFDKEKVDDSACQAAALLTHILLAQAKTKDAQAAADRAIALSQQVSDYYSRYDALLAAAAVSGEAGKIAEAAKALQAVQEDASRHGYLGYELEARLRLGELEVRAGKPSIGRARLEKVQHDAQGKGFLLIARKAAPARS